jgi:hypothetical protein
MSHVMTRCVLIGLLAIFGAACALPLNGLDDAPAGHTAPGSHPTGPGGTPGTHPDAGSGVTSNDAGTPTPEASAQQDAADDGSDADDGGDSADDSGNGGHGHHGGDRPVTPLPE